MKKAPSPNKWLFVVGAIGAGVAVVIWVLATEWHSQTEASASAIVGVALVAVTWRYTSHTGEMVKEMREETKAADKRHRELLDEAHRDRQASRVKAALALAAELRELSRCLDGLKPAEDGKGTLPPYPVIELVSLPLFATEMGTMPESCTAAVLAVHYQLIAANARADDRNKGYWKRAQYLPALIDAAVEELDAVSAHADIS